MKTALVFAAGLIMSGWTKEHPKQLALIGNQPLILRILGQLESRGLGSVIVVTDNEKIKEAVPRYFEPKVHNWWTETLLSTRELWADWTAIVNGDTIYSDAAMNMLSEEPGPLRFIGDKVHTELFVFTKDQHDLVASAAEVATAKAEERQAESLSKQYKTARMQGFRAMHWTFYRMLAVLPLVNLGRRVYSPTIHRLLPQRDYTSDIDGVGHYKGFLARHAWARNEKG